LHKTVLIDRAVSVTIEARVDTTVWQLTASDMSQNNASKSVHYITHQGYYTSLGYIKLSERGKGQIISKCLFGVFNFFQKTNEKKSHSSKNEFICLFFGRIQDNIIFFRDYLTFRSP
jgi:hypothetical protein